MQVRRINIFGGPGVGKSTMAATVYSALKRDGKYVELVREKVKTWAYQGREPEGFEQVSLFSGQLDSEEQLLKNDDLAIVTDCPLELVVFYTKHYGYSYWEELQSLTEKFNEEYPPLDLLIEREVEYDDRGRFQNVSEAKEVDDALKDFLLPSDRLIVGDFDHVKNSVHHYV